jgi:magnesium transporter
MGGQADDGGNVRKHTFNGVTWVDVQAPGQTVLEQLEKDYGLHPVHLHESIREVQHNEVEREKRYLFFVMHYPILERTTGKIRVGQLGMFLAKAHIITVHAKDAPFIDDFYVHFTRTADKQEARSAGYVLFRVIAQLLKTMEEMAERIDVELDAAEDLVFANRSSDAERIGRLREKIIRLRRLTGPKRLILEDLREQIGAFAGTDLTHYYAHNLKTVNRLWDELEEARETIEIYKDADFITSTEQTNKILAVLTLVFTFTIPATVVAALYGMNVFVPGGLESGSWAFLGKFTTFWLVLAASGLLALGMYIYFHKKRWF